MTLESEKKTSLSILIPCHNSAGNIEVTSQKLKLKIDSISSNFSNLETIFIENGSSDETLSILDKIMSKSILPNMKIIKSDKGLGNALRAGSSHARGDYIAFIPDDLSYDLQEIDAALTIDKGLDLVILSKYIKPFSYGRSIRRVFIGLVFSVLREFILRLRVWDSQSTFLGKASSIKYLLSKTEEKNFLITTEIIYIARCNSMRILELPALKINEEYRKSTLKFKDGINMALGLLSIKLRAGK